MRTAEIDLTISENYEMGLAEKFLTALRLSEFFRLNVNFIKVSISKRLLVK